MRGSGSSRRRPRCRSPGIPTLGTAFVLGGPLQLEEIRLETGAGIVPVRLEREEGADRVRADGPAAADGRAVRATTAELLDSARRRALRAAGRALRQRHAARVRRASVRGRGGGAAAGSPRLARAADPRVNCFAGDGQRAGRRGCSRPPAASPRIRRPARRRARSRSTSPATGGSRFGEEIEISQGVEIGRPSKLYARVDGLGGRRSSASRSAARRSSSRAASSRSEAAPVRTKASAKLGSEAPIWYPGAGSFAIRSLQKPRSAGW